MPTDYKNTFSSTPAKDWDDRSMTVYALTKTAENESMEPSVVITRDKMEDQETFAEYIARQSSNMESDIPQFDILSSKMGGINGLKAHEIRCRWMAPGGRIQQRLVFLNPSHGELVSFAATAQDEFFASRETDFNNILASITIEETKSKSENADS